MGDILLPRDTISNLKPVYQIKLGLVKKKKKKPPKNKNKNEIDFSKTEPVQHLHWLKDAILVRVKE